MSKLAFQFDPEETITMERALFALWFWQCARVQKEKDFWWSLYVQRRERAFGLTPGFRKFKR